MLFVLLWPSMCEENFHSFYSFAWGNIQTFRLFRGIFLLVLRNSKDYLDIFHKCLDNTVVVTKLKICQVSLCFEHFWAFLVHFVVFSPNTTEQSNIFLCMNFCSNLAFPKYKPIAVMKSWTRCDGCTFTLCICVFVCKLIQTYLQS